MELIYKAIPYDGSNEAPAVIVDKNPGEVWWIPSRPVVLQQPVELSMDVKSRQVRIPLLPYLISGDPCKALAFATAVGIHASHGVKATIKQLVIVTNKELLELPPHKTLEYRFFIGLGFNTGRVG